MSAYVFFRILAVVLVLIASNRWSRDVRLTFAGSRLARWWLIRGVNAAENGD